MNLSYKKDLTKQKPIPIESNQDIPWYFNYSFSRWISLFQIKRTETPD